MNGEIRIIVAAMAGHLLQYPGGERGLLGDIRELDLGNDKTTICTEELVYLECKSLIWNDMANLLDDTAAAGKKMTGA